MISKEQRKKRVAFVIYPKEKAHKKMSHKNKKKNFSPLLPYLPKWLFNFIC